MSKCPKCGNKVFRHDPAGDACVICGYFEHKFPCAIEELWAQYRVNAQFAQMDVWVNAEFPVSRTWGLIAEIEILHRDLFTEYACV